MAVYTPIDKKHLTEIVEDYNLGKLGSCTGITAGSVNTNYLLETSRGKFLLRIDEVKNELDVSASSIWSCSCASMRSHARSLWPTARITTTGSSPAST